MQATSSQSCFSKVRYSKHSRAVFNFSLSLGFLLPRKSSVKITPQVAISFSLKIDSFSLVGFFKKSISSFEDLLALSEQTENIQEPSELDENSEVQEKNTDEQQTESSNDLDELADENSSEDDIKQEIPQNQPIDLVEDSNDDAIDEEVEIWIDIRGTRGVPSSIKSLLEDAEWKLEKLKELLKEVTK